MLDYLPILLSAPALPPTVPGFRLLFDLAKVLGVPAALFLLARFISLRDKKREKVVAANEAAAAAQTQALKARSETAEQERVALRADSEKNKADHERLQQQLAEMKAATQLIQNEVQALKMNAVEAAMRSEATKETLDRVHIQLGRLIDTYRSLS